MTIGIGAIGPKAGLAIFRALEAAERVGEGSIGGFAVYRVISSDGQIYTYTTQRGGSATLVTRGEATGGLPPQEALDAPVAALISSGPDRPEPLERCIPGETGIGLVTGHRIPMAPTKNKKPLNLEVLDLMRAGRTAPEAVKALMGDHPQIDAGIIAVDIKGNLGAQNSTRVLNRPDMMEVFREDRETGCKVAVFINEIHPKEAAVVAAAKCLQVLVGEREPDFEITVKTGIMVTLSDKDTITIDDDYIATAVTITDQTILEGEQICVVPYINAKVIKGSGEVGHIISEPLTILKDGVIVDLVG
ncbi:MAG: hypothetical protein JRC92_04195, partial [Deltaproteobacteria bacterium]|nr:hypothetical protein [Deltaproteobacteria bacterium]